ncbi:MAG TPA: Gfo/Idh/MocA family oxidoreductase, partial [Candidatus Angelobacter sp.]|nr:Gfo/Idh/MocA family oxidoreductase [Candidatus Angelobacter sp.]
GIGIVGAGKIFEQHAAACGSLAGRARLIAIADIDEGQLQKAAGKYSIPFAAADYRALLDRRDVDVITVCTPPVLHERIVAEALEAGKFVICEKPLAHTLESADRIIAAANRHPGKLSTVYQFRYLPEVQRTIWLRDHGHLGGLLFGRFHRFAKFEAPAKPAKDGKPAKPAKKRSPWWGQWQTAGGGVVMTQLIHEIDLMQHIFGRAIEVTATMETLHEAIESEDTCAATVRFESGAMVSCQGTMTAQRSSHGFDVIGERASAHSPWALESLNPAWRDESRYAVLEAHPLAEETIVKQTGDSAHTPYLAAVVAAILQSRSLPIGPDEARASLEICTAIYASALSGRPVQIPVDKTNICYAGLTTAIYDGRQRLNRKANAAAEQIPA